MEAASVGGRWSVVGRSVGRSVVKKARVEKSNNTCRQKARVEKLDRKDCDLDDVAKMIHFWLFSKRPNEEYI